MRSWGSSVTDAELLARVDALQAAYARALDRRDMQGWLDCFEDEASYVCTARENEEQGLPLALMMDDCRARLVDRVKFVSEVWAGTFEDYATRHLVQRLACRRAPSGLYEVESNFVVTYTSARGRSEVLTAGVYEDRVALSASGARFAAKKAILDTVATPRYLVYPV